MNFTFHVLFILFSTISPQSFASPAVEGGSEKVVQDNQQTLSSVIYMIYEAPTKKSCSAALVAPNLILTAAHCVKGLSKGSSITLNNIPDFKISDLTAILPDKPISDLALIKVTPPTPKSFLDDLPFLSIASPSQAAELLKSAQFLISGYGLENMSDIRTHQNTVGTLRAGYATPMSEERKGDFKLGDAEIIFTGTRSSRTVIENDAGAIFDDLNMSFRKKYTVQGSLGLPGDSGSPAIVIDQNKKAWIVGVASRFGSLTKPTVKVSVLPEGADEPLPMKFDPRQSVMTYQDQYISELKRLNIIAKKGFNKVNYSIFIDSLGEYINDYTSVMEAKNYEFIQSSIKSMTSSVQVK